VAIEIRVLDSGEEEVLSRVAPGVFDRAIDARLAKEFLADRRHHLAVALDDGVVVGFASALHYVHPDKPPQLWINEIGVAPTHRRQGFGKDLLAALLRRGRDSGCAEAWVLTRRSNLPATRLYEALGGIQDPQDQVMFTFSL
jgi:aminoglycoside 6'-N-acetyltransferase I